MNLSTILQYALMGAALGILTTLTILKLADPSLLVGVLLGILGIGAHVSGVKTAVPLVPADATPARAAAPVDESGVAPQ